MKFKEIGKWAVIWRTKRSHDWVFAEDTISNNPNVSMDTFNRDIPTGEQRFSQMEKVGRAQLVRLGYQEE